MLEIIFIIITLIFLLYKRLYVITCSITLVLLFYLIKCYKKSNDNYDSYNIKPTSIIKEFQYYIDIQDCYKKIVDMIQQSKKRIIFSCFACNMDTEFYKHHTMKDLLNNAQKRGVNIQIFYNTTAEYTNNTIPDLQKKLHKDIHITTITASSTHAESLQSVIKQIAYSYNHQKFLIGDNEILFGGCDIDPWERKGYKIINKNNFYWHELGISFPLPPKLIDWIQQFKSSNEKQVSQIPSPPPPFVSKQTEINTLLYMIQHSKDIIYIEHQLLAITKFSNDSSYSILKALAKRLTQSCKDKDSLQIYIITNESQDDEYSMFIQFFSSNGLQLSLCGILELIPSKYKEEAMKKLHVFTLKNGKHSIKTHSNIFITNDSKNNYHLVRSSSNLSDRSFGFQPCDIELGVYISHTQTIKQLLNDLISLHTNSKDTTITEKGYLKKLTFTCGATITRELLQIVTESHPATGNCPHTMIIKNIQ